MGSEKIVKSSFNQTCSRFSQFLKERRSFGQIDVSSEIDIKGANAAINLFPKKMEKERMSLELFPLMSSLVAASGVENSTKTMSDSRELAISKEEPKNNTTTPSMTIFYGGRVLVFDELPEDKAREIMSLAINGTMSSRSQTQTQTLGSINNIVPSHLTQDAVPQGVFSLYDLPIARRVSLHRFMEKRKHRVAATAPYQLQISSTTMANSQKSDIMRSSYEQQQLELKL